MDRKEIMAFFNKRPRNCLIGTTNGNGEVNVAVYGSPRMIDEGTVVLAARNNRSYRNLQENPHAALFVTEPGEIKHDSKGFRVYLERIRIETEGDLLNEFRETVARRAGKKSADGLEAAIHLKITEIRTLMDPSY